MKYYIQTIEQVKKEEGGYNEYANVEKVNDESTAMSKFYKKLSDVSSSTAHQFMDIKIVNSLGGVVKKDSIGEYAVEE